MPELPDVVVYVECLERRVVGQALERVRVASPFVLRTAEPPIGSAEGKAVRAIRRLGKRIAFVLEDDLFLVLHLMIAGRLAWAERGAKIPGKIGLLALDFTPGTLIFREAGSKKRASAHLVRGEDALQQFHRGGLEVLDATLADFRAVLARENHTLKIALIDPTLFSGIGNAYSDEILHRARLSPVKLTSRLTAEETEALFAATQAVLGEWTERLRREAGDGFPNQGVTAFREGMAVHGRYKLPCPDCGSPVQRIVRGDHETNYCPTCQTDGKLLADRALSKLLKGDWPKTLDALEDRLPGRTGAGGGQPGRRTRGKRHPQT
ncbi:MAG: DNA-formamidopyrimidine glycosylase family protein [Planctomycetota bacterium]